VKRKYKIIALVAGVIIGLIIISIVRLLSETSTQYILTLMGVVVVLSIIFVILKKGEKK
jgi:uncharacterized protein YacL